MTTTPKHPKSAGKLAVQNLTVDELIALFRNPKFLFKGQRGHEKNAKKKKHVRGLLQGDSQRFAGAYCKELKCYKLLDGYHRAAQVANGNASFLPGADIQLTSFYVETAAELQALYDQFNSATAAKKATCYFESGLRAAGLENEISSEQIMKGAKAYAVQFAADVRGTTQVMGAVVKVQDGIRLVNSFDLPRSRHEIAGVLGAFFAIAQHCPDKELVEEFVRNVNANVYRPVKPTLATSFVKSYHDALLTYGFGRTGGTANDLAFRHGLGYFVCLASARRARRAVVPVPLTLAQFMKAMDTLPLKKTVRT